MQENNFEKQVQQKTDELKLNPSDEVWQRVAGAIAKKTTNRWIFAIILLLLVIISSAIFIIWDRRIDKEINLPVSENGKPAQGSDISKSLAGSSRQISTTATNAKTGGKKNEAGLKIKITKDIPRAKSKDTRLITTLSSVSKKATASFTGNEPGNDNAIASKKAGNDPFNHSNKPTYKTKEKITLAVTNGYTGDAGNVKTVSADREKMIVDPVNLSINEIHSIRQVGDTVSKDRTGIKKFVPGSIAVAQTATDRKGLPVKKSPQLNKQSGWKIGLNFSLGISATQNGYLGIIGLGSSEALKALDSNPNQSTGGNAGQGTYTPYSPSKIKAGTGIALGAFVQKTMSAKTYLTLGLNYRGYNSSMMIGSRWDSISNINFNRVFYRAGNASKYKNHFHFIELPVALRYKLSKQNKLPVYLNGGLAVSRLIGSNALQFDTLSGSYYKNNSLLNKTKVHISLGLFFSLPGNSKNPFLVGPDINYGLTKMANSGLYRDRHYSYFGILAQKTIGKK